MSKNEKKGNSSIQRFVEDERGEFGIKQIAATVAVIILIGAVVGIVQGELDTWIDWIWTKFTNMIDSTITSS